MSRETPCLGIVGHEAEVHAAVVVDGKRVEKIILVVVGPHRRERTDKALQEERHIVLEDIHFLEHLAQELLYAVAGENFVDAR